MLLTLDHIRKISAVRNAHHRSGGGGTGGKGGGTDGQLAAKVYGWVFAGLDKEECYRRWVEYKPAIEDPAWPWIRTDFERHHRGAERKYQERGERNYVIAADESHSLLPTCGKEATDAQLDKILKWESRRGERDNTVWKTAPAGAWMAYQAAVWRTQRGHACLIDQLPGMTPEIKAFLAPWLCIHADGTFYVLPPERPAKRGNDYEGMPAGADYKAGKKRLGEERRAECLKVLISRHEGEKLSNREWTAMFNSAEFRAEMGIDGYWYQSVNVIGATKRALKDAEEIHEIEPAVHYYDFRRWHHIPAAYMMGPDPVGTPEDWNSYVAMHDLQSPDVVAPPGTGHPEAVPLPV